MRILILGASGLIGSILFKTLYKEENLSVYGSLRSNDLLKYFSLDQYNNLLVDVEALDFLSVKNVVNQCKPDVIINCIGLTKHISDGSNFLKSIELNALFPHRLAELSESINAKFIHISTDCIFSGDKGSYTELDFPDAIELYGRSKALGEINYDNNLTIRTSTIGHELISNHGLLNWFLMQESSCKGYKNAIFSGLPTVVLAEIIRDYILPDSNMVGVYNVAAEPINKYELLKIISVVYKKNIDIIEDFDFCIDRSLDYTKFSNCTGYMPLDWHALVERMHQLSL